MSDNRLFLPVKLKTCSATGTGHSNQFFFLTPEGEIRLDNLCLGFEDTKKVIKVLYCNGNNGTRVSEKYRTNKL